MRLIEVPHALALDTAILAIWAHRWYRGDVTARRLVEALFRSNARLVLTVHHVIELLGHESDSVVESRAHFVRSLEQMFWVKARNGGPIGGILDLHAIEVRARLDDREVALPELLAIVRGDAVAFGDARVIAALMEETTFVTACRDRIRRRRIVASIARTQPSSPHTNRRVVPKQLQASLTTFLAHFEKEQQRLESQLSSVGDPDLSEPDKIARRFFDDLREHATAVAVDGSVNLASLLSRLGIDEVDLKAHTSANALGDKYVWKRRARLIARLAGVPEDAVEQLHPSSLPSMFLCEEISTVRKRRPRAEGGDFDDAALACLAFYVTLTSADKRTVEAIRQIRRRRPELDRIMSPVVKIPTLEALEVSLTSFA